MHQGALSEAKRRNELFPASIVAIFAIMSVVLLGRLQYYPSIVSGTDAHAYLTYALSFREHGLLSDFGNIRTYGYPLFISIVSFLSTRDPIILALICGLLQVAFYGGAVLWLASATDGYSPAFGLAVRVGLLLNPFVVSIVVDLVSESIAITLLIMMIAVLLKIANLASAAYATTWLSFGSVLANFAVMVRPASLAFVIAWGVVTIAYLYRRRRIAMLFAHTVIWGLSGALLWAPQYSYNLINFGIGSVFPVCPIGRIQIAYGILVLKYETLIRVDGVIPLFLVNPWYDGFVSDLGTWRWYFERPLRGLATLVGHVVGSFDVNHLFVYVHGWPPPWRIPVSFLMWAIQLFGIAAGIRIAAAGILAWNSRQHLSRLNLFAIFISVVVAIIGAVNSVSAVETRLNVIPIALFCVLGVSEIGQLYRRSSSIVLWQVAVILILAAGAAAISSIIQDYASTQLPAGSEFATQLAASCKHSSR
jgi:hypothetical protein